MDQRRARKDQPVTGGVSSRRLTNGATATVGSPGSVDRSTRHRFTRSVEANGIRYAYIKGVDRSGRGEAACFDASRSIWGSSLLVACCWWKRRGGTTTIGWPALMLPLHWKISRPPARWRPCAGNHPAGKAQRLQFARCCYDHLAGSIGVAVTHSLQE